VVEALGRLTPHDLATYPDYRATIELAARWFGVDPGWTALTNGLDEGILAASVAAGLGSQPGWEGIIVEPAFEEYRKTIEAAGGRVRALAVDDQMRVPDQPLLAAIGPTTRIVFLNTPHNPTGLLVRASLWDRVAAAMPAGGLVFVDEAYAEFGGGSYLPALARTPNVIVGRTFAKAWGLAALRLGAVIAHPAMIARLARVLPPFSVNICAATALAAALEDEAWMTRYREEVASSRALFYEAFARLGLCCWESQANFVLVRVGPAATAVQQALVRRGVLVRDRSMAPGCAGCLRFSAGLVAETRAAIAALAEVVCGAR
jgi:histidinol-phosphate aminotransferase